MLERERRSQRAESKGGMSGQRPEVIVNNENEKRKQTTNLDPGYQRGITRQGDNCDFQPRTYCQVTFLIVFGGEKSRSGL